MSLKERIERWFARLGFGVQRRVDFYRILLGARKIGVPEYQVVQRIYAIGVRRDVGWMKSVFGRIAANMRRGDGFAEASRWVLPNDEYAMLLAGEQRGVLQTVYENLIRFSEQVAELKREMIKNVSIILAYTLAVLAIIFLVASLLMEAVKDFPPTRDPFALGYLKVVGFINDWRWSLLAFIAALGGIFSWTLPQVRPGLIRGTLDQKVFPWTLYKQFSSAYFLSAASVMLGSGEPLKEGIMRLRKSASPWVDAYFRKMLRNLAEGMNETQAIIKSGFLHPDEETRLEIYEISGDLSASLQQLSVDAAANVGRKTKRALAVVFASLLVVIGVFIISTFYTMYTIAQDASRIVPPS